MNILEKQIEQFPSVQNDVSTLLAVISRAASDPNVDISKMERLMSMYQTIEEKRAEAEFNIAMNKAQTEIGRVATDKENQQTRSTYATYAQLDRAVRPVYTANGFALSFGTTPSSEGMVAIICHVSHQAGHSREYRIDMPADGKGAKGNDVMTKTHAVGSGTTYGMRYLLKMIFNIAIGVDPDDDDGNAADIEYITDEQLTTLHEWLESTQSNEAKFLKWLKVDSLDKLPARAYEDAIRALKAKVKT